MPGLQPIDPSNAERIHLIRSLSIPGFERGPVSQCSPDGSLLAVASFIQDFSAFSKPGAGMSLWQAGANQLVWDYAPDLPDFGSLSTSFSPDGEFIVYGTFNRLVVLSARDGKERFTLSFTAPMGDVLYSPGGDWLISASDDQKIRLWNAADGELLKTLAGHNHYVNGVAIHPQQKLLFSGSADKTLGVWDIEKGELVTLLKGHEAALLRVAVNPAGTLVATVSWDGTVGLWGVE